MKKGITLMSTMVVLLFSQAQEVTPSDPLPRNTIFVEALGNGLFGSINYERQITKTPGVSFRAGFGFFADNGLNLTLPLSVQFQFQLKKNRFLDLGVGYTFEDTYADDLFGRNGDNFPDDYHYIFLCLSYRKVFSSDWMWKISFTPIITDSYDVIFVPWFGFAFGKLF